MKIVFRGKNRGEARKKSLDYWMNNRKDLEATFKEFILKCTCDPSGRVICYRR